MGALSLKDSNTAYNEPFVKLKSTKEVFLLYLSLRYWKDTWNKDQFLPFLNSSHLKTVLNM